MVREADLRANITRVLLAAEMVGCQFYGTGEKRGGAETAPVFG